MADDNIAEIAARELAKREEEAALLQAAQDAEADNSNTDERSLADRGLATAFGIKETFNALPPAAQTGLAAAGGFSAAQLAGKVAGQAGKVIKKTARSPLAIFGLAAIGAGQKAPGESDKAYRSRLRRVMENSGYEELAPNRRPTNSDTQEDTDKLRGGGF